MKKEKQKTSSSINILKPLKMVTKRFHLIFFFVLIVACLAGAVLLINSTLKPDLLDPSYSSSINSGIVDQATVDKLNALHTSAQGAPAPALPPGRINPVNE